MRLRASALNTRFLAAFFVAAFFAVLPLLAAVATEPILARRARASVKRAISASISARIESIPMATEYRMIVRRDYGRRRNTPG
ncbi:MAG: hypothetical protein ABR928_16370, partial [Terracidiphilus sp.]